MIFIFYRDTGSIVLNDARTQLVQNGFVYRATNYRDNKIIQNKIKFQYTEKSGQVLIYHFS